MEAPVDRNELHVNQVDGGIHQNEAPVYRSELHVIGGMVSVTKIFKFFNKSEVRVIDIVHRPKCL
jgi:hypothetical protein